MDLAITIANCITTKKQFGMNCANPNKLSIGFGINAKYARPMGVAMTSIMINNPELYLDFHILATSIEQDDLDRLKKLSDQFSNILITVYTVDDSFISHLPTAKRLPLPTYFRFFIPFILKERDRFLYLDADILCLGEIAELANLKLNKYPAAVVPDVLSFAIRQSKAIKLKDERYFNAGVLLINIPEWLEQNISEKALALLSDRSKNLSFLDQDALNLILEDIKKILPNKWNYISEAHKNTSLPNNIMILHCASHPKPWDVHCDKKTQAHKLYSYYESLSPWSGLPLRPPSIYSDARRYATKLFTKGSILSGTYWYYKYLKMKYRKKE